MADLDVLERFKKSVIEHEMIVVRNDGLHRHLTFKSPRTYNHHFHITTWPGYLAISGDAPARRGRQDREADRGGFWSQDAAGGRALHSRSGSAAAGARRNRTA